MAYGLGRVVEGFAQGREDRRQIQRQEAADERAEEMHGLSVTAKEMGIEAAETERERGDERWRDEQDRIKHAGLAREFEENQRDRSVKFQRRSDELNRALMIGDATGKWRHLKELWNSEIAEDVDERRFDSLRVVTDEDGNRFFEFRSEDGDAGELPYEDFMETMIGLASPDGMIKAHDHARQARSKAAARQEEHMNRIDLKLLERDTRLMTEKVKTELKERSGGAISTAQSGRITNNLTAFYGSQLQNGMFTIRQDNREAFERANTVASRAFVLFAEAGQPITEAEAAMLGRQAADGPIDFEQAKAAATAEIELQVKETGRSMSKAEKETAVAARAQEIVAESDAARQLAVSLGIWDHLTQPVEQRRSPRRQEETGDGVEAEDADAFLRGAAASPMRRQQAPDRPDK